MRACVRYACCCAIACGRSSRCVRSCVCACARLAKMQTLLACSKGGYVARAYFSRVRVCVSKSGAPLNNEGVSCGVLHRLPCGSDSSSKTSSGSLLDSLHLRCTGIFVTQCVQYVILSLGLPGPEVQVSKLRQLRLQTSTCRHHNSSAALSILWTLRGVEIYNTSLSV